jgi:ABC-2 type transport system permease protein
VAATTQPTRPREDTGLRPGWMTVAAKEFADHLTSLRFYVLLVVVAAAALIPLYFAAERIRDAAAAASGAPAVFLALFVLGPEGVNFGPITFTVSAFVAIAAPLLGVAFGFDAVNGERAQGTLPRLLSQPIHRDDVINGKFAAGLITISLAILALVAFISGFGMLRLGIMPALEELLRIVGWFVVTVLYVALWLAFGTLLSVVIRRAATSALVAIAAWLMVTLFATLLTGLIAGVLAPAPPDATSQQQIASLTMRENLARLSPGQLFSEATGAILDPSVQTFNIVSLIEVNSDQRAIPSILSFGQSLLVIWPQFVALIALTAIAFALAYVAFMRQEVRA